MEKYDFEYYKQQLLDNWEKEKYEILGNTIFKYHRHQLFQIGDPEGAFRLPFWICQGYRDLLPGKKGPDEFSFKNFEVGEIFKIEHFTWDKILKCTKEIISLNESPYSSVTPNWLKESEYMNVWFKATYYDKRGYAEMFCAGLMFLGGNSFLVLNGRVDNIIKWKKKKSSRK